jgi:hypothetical protein
MHSFCFEGLSKNIINTFNGQSNNNNYIITSNFMEDWCDVNSCLISSESDSSEKSQNDKEIFADYILEQPLIQDPTHKTINKEDLKHILFLFVYVQVIQNLKVSKYLK